MRRVLLALVALAVLTQPRPIAAQERGTLTIAAASDLQTALPQIVDGFEKASGIRATVTFGSSGNFYAQIQNGAPFDVFLSADADYPRRLGETGAMDATSLYEYAAGGLVLWTRNDSKVNIAGGLAVVRTPQVRRIAIANPAVAPYGRAAVAALRSARLIDAVEKKLVYAENLAQAAQFVQSGNADVALIGHALALGASLRATGHFVDVPAALHPPIAQTAGIVSSSRNHTTARAFIDYLRSPAATAVLKSFGFTVPATAGRGRG
jgi:molybdate transport system substrate-binding protein